MRLQEILEKPWVPWLWLGVVVVATILAIMSVVKERAADCLRDRNESGWNINKTGRSIQVCHRGECITISEK